MFQTLVPVGSRQPSSGNDAAFALPWVAELALESEELNAGHGVVLEKLNSLLFAIASDRDRVDAALADLSAATTAHFAEEDELMLGLDYPGREAHIDKHRQLLDSIGQMGFALTSDRISWSSSSALHMLEQWFIPHLTHADRQLAYFIAARSAVLNAS